MSDCPLAGGMGGHSVTGSAERRRQLLERFGDLAVEGAAGGTPRLGPAGSPS
ncbi:hypothetical protein AB0H83_25575 [Dactylosporangium sp. NPDC050688]|uniref:hypothetical protein n=1 Tax=Dactylosporangium sp. NPDC050688 TaxID=3157217 RepID=UPI0033FDD8FC